MLIVSEESSLFKNRIDQSGFAMVNVRDYTDGANVGRHTEMYDTFLGGCKSNLFEPRMVLLAEA